MKDLVTLYQHDIVGGQMTKVDRSQYFRRMSVRAVMRDATGRVALMHSRKYNYYKLPGGGVDDGESLAEALERELLEETGCTVAVGAMLGEVVEYRDFAQMIQTSACYEAVAIGSGEPRLTVEELAEQFEVVWAQDISDAIRLVRSTPVKEDNFQARFMMRREQVILNAAQAASELGVGNG